MRIVVTGGSGKAGRWVVRDLREHGHDVLNVDLKHDGSPHGQCVLADLTDLGQAHDLIAGADAVVHLAAIPAPELRAAGDTFRINTLSTYNVFAAAVAAGVRRIVWASSETVLGLPFDRPPDFAPIDETITPATRDVLRPVEARRRDDGRAGRAAQRHRRRRAAHLEHHGARRLRGLPVLLGRPPAAEVEPVGLRRLPRRRPGRPAGPRGRRRGRAGVHRRRRRHGHAPALAPSSWPRCIPDVPLRRAPEGRETLLSIDRARALLGYEPAHRWADHVAVVTDASTTGRCSGATRRTSRGDPRRRPSPTPG